jgi:DNA invertase Pin-like site-specific DNA recombinase
MRELLTKQDVNEVLAKVCIIYIQGNTQEELDFQLEACEAYASEKGYIVAGEVIGAKAEPNLDELVYEVNEGLIDVVIAYTLHKFSRSALDVWRLEKELDILGTTIETAEEHEERRAFFGLEKLFSKNFKKIQK